ncbi:tetratricopeptide repeat protein [Brevibacillus sp. H7]|uniref:tetratricopeptide repeat protein n=1 Tax=Brevibacillus sp. H7 TaxID=3349138 RepID=UPI00380D4C2D
MKYYVNILVALIFLTACNTNSTEQSAQLKSQQSDEILQNKLKETVKLIEGGKYDEAKTVLADLLMKEENNGAIDYYLGNIARKQQKNDEALMHYKNAIAKSPSLKEAYNNLASMEILMGKYDDAFKTINEGLAKDPNFSELIFKKGQLLFVQKNYSECIQVMKSIESNPKFYDAIRFIGLSYIQLNKKDDGVVYLNKYLSIAPEGSPVKEEIKAVMASVKTKK